MASRAGASAAAPSDAGPPDAAERLLPEGRTAGTVHGTAVALDGRGLLILGQSGSGKSALALGMIAQGACLVADDGTHVAVRDGTAWLDCAPGIRGLIEARGLGLVRLPAVPATPLWAVLRLHATQGPRLPPPGRIDVAGLRLPLLSCAPAPHLASALVVCLRHGVLPTDTPDALPSDDPHR